MPGQVVRDFRYLDVERVRSLLSQMARGYPEAYEEVRTRAGAVGLKLGVDIGGEAGSSASESRSVHHYQYTLLESTLEETNRLNRLDKGRTPESALQLQDGAIVKGTGRLRALHPAQLAKMLGSFGDMMERLAVVADEAGESAPLTNKRRQQMRNLAIRGQASASTNSKR